MKKILLCFGTRPEAIKMAPVFYSLKSKQFEVKVCVTAQHREMLDQVLDFFEIVPDYDLNLMKKNQSLNTLSSRILEKIDSVFDDFNPEIVLVHGDTTTSFIVSLAAFHRQISIGHVEAGLRTYNKYSPFPEELNRQLTARLADLHFAPTDSALQNLSKEGVGTDKIFITGNTVIDALAIGLQKIEEGYASADLKMVKSLLNPSSKVILVTGHRRESFGEGFRNLCMAIKEISHNNDVQIVYPLHLNPNIKMPVTEIIGNIGNVHLIPPVDYSAFIFLMSQSYLILTDSGGVQEEAPSLGKPVLLLRKNTERPEGLSSGNTVMVGMNRELIVEKVTELLYNKTFYQKMAQKNNTYGDGKASERIAKILKEKLS